MKIFVLPDLGEGLQEAEIVDWHVAPGGEVKADQPLVSVETAKALVEIPAPYDGKVEKLFAQPGETVHVGAPLIGFEGEEASARSGTVVGSVQTGGAPVEESAGATAIGQSGKGFKATPAVRALANKLNIDLTMVTPSGPDGLITAGDVQRVARILAEAGPQEVLRGVRRAMALNMTLAHAEVAAATLMDDADVHAWAPGQDMLVRLIRALVAGCRAEPALNAWYDSKAIGRRVLKQVHLGLAVDSPDGLFVPVLRDADQLDAPVLRQALDTLIAQVKSRKIKPEDLRGSTITLSNYGTIAGRYASPVVLPPTVAIVGAGRARDQVVAWEGAPTVHKVIPLSLTFDHRAVTGGEAGRFLAAVIADLQKTN